MIFSFVLFEQCPKFHLKIFPSFLQISFQDIVFSITFPCLYRTDLLIFHLLDLKFFYAHFYLPLTFIPLGSLHLISL